MKTVKVRRSGLIVAIAVGAVVGPSAGVASAVVSGQQTASDTSVRNAAAVKSATASCPPGKRVIGGGANVESPGSRIVLQGVRPSATGVVARAQGDSAGVEWGVTAYAVCADPPPGLQIVSTTSPTNASPKTAAAICPGSKRLLGSGGEINGGQGQVGFTEIHPFTNQVNATGDNIGAFNQSWSVTSYAICADPLAGQQIIRWFSQADSVPTKSSQATCPTGKRLLGTGFVIVGGGSEVGAVQLRPLPAAASVTATEHSSIQSSWRLDAFAVCGGLNVEFVTATSPNDTTTTKSVSASCPAAKRVVGSGLRVGGSSPGNVSVDGIVPSPGSVGVTARVDENGTLGNWTASARAVCANPLPGQQIVTATSATHSSTAKTVIASCPAGKQVVGTGAAITGGPGETSVDDVVPGLSDVTVTAHEDDNGTADAWSVTAYAVCAAPLAGRQIVQAGSGSGSFAAKSATATCPPATTLLGTGFRLDGAYGQARVENVQPSPTNVAISANEDDDRTPDNWTLTAYAVCATP